MRKSTLVIAAAAGAAVLAATVFLVGGWQCVGFTCIRDGGRIDVKETHTEKMDDGTTLVIQHIDFTFDAPQKGLHYDIPALYREGGVWYRKPIVVRTVRDGNGLVLNHAEGAAGRSLRVWIGDPADSHGGKQDYLITYVQFAPQNAGSLAPLMPYVPYAAIALFAAYAMLRLFKEKKH